MLLGQAPGFLGGKPTGKTKGKKDLKKLPK
jgi:hypothetical protein